MDVDPLVNPPAGFEPLFRSSPFLDHNGPFFFRNTGEDVFVVGLRILPSTPTAGVARMAAC